LKKQKEQVRVGFTEWQYNKVHAFLEWLKGTGLPQQELGEPIRVEVDWSIQNELGRPHVLIKGPKGQKVIPIKNILESGEQA
jgi:hypothetical protein